MAVLSRVSCDYDPNEDRMRFSAETESGQHQVLWCTHRLLNRLLPHLIAWLEKQAGPAESPGRTHEPADRGTRQGFAQETAAARIKPQTPVQADSNQATHLIREIDIKTNKLGVVLIFKHDAEADSLSLQSEQLRQWLIIMYRIWQHTEWPDEIWPAWIAGLGDQAGSATELH